ncbi:MAG: hypothetical protein OEW35_19185 [Gammaproteobacteria bacterium]|nr:hypothetical protein [Gammaproteobacteria bacterium]
MRKVLLTLVFAASLSGCIKLQMPDDMVSDAIKAIKGSDDENSSDDGQTTFTHSVVGAADATESELRKKCLTELESRTAELLDPDSPTYTVISESVTVTGDKAIASCTVSIS